MRRRAALLAVLVLVALGIAAFQWRRRIGVAVTADAPARLFGPDHDVVEVRSLSAVGEAMDRLARLRLVALAASLAGYPDAESLAQLVGQQIGVDVRRRDDLGRMGIDPDRRLALGRPPGGGLLAAVPTRDAGAFERALTDLAATRLGATERRDTAGFGRPRTLFRRPDAEALIGLEQVGPYTLLIAGKALEAEPRAGSLADRADYARARDRFAAATLFTVLPPESEGAVEMGWPGNGAAALTVGADAIDVAAIARGPGGAALGLRALSGSEGQDLLARLEPDAFLVLALGGDPALLGRAWNEAAPEPFAAAARRAGIDVGAEVFGSLKPGAALSLSVAPTVNLATMPDLDPRLTNPFAYLHLTAIGRVRDPAIAAATIERLAAAAPSFGATVVRRTIGAAAVHTVRYHLGEGVSFALAGEYAVVTGGAGRIDAVLARLVVPAGEAPRAAKGMAVRGLCAQIDVGRLVESVQALPASAYGVGGFAIRAAVNRWLDAVGEIGLAAIRVESAEGTLDAGVRLTLREDGR